MELEHWAVVWKIQKERASLYVFTFSVMEMLGHLSKPEKHGPLTFFAFWISR